MDLSKNDVQEYYNGLANSVLWPILHYRGDLQEYSQADAPATSGSTACSPTSEPARQGGRRRLGSRLSSDLLGRELRARGHKNRIGFFLHTPCAPADILQTLPQHDLIFGSLVDYDLVGFQTANDRDNFARYLEALGAKARGGGAYEMNGRQVRLGTFPVSIETKAYKRLARNAGRSAMVSLVRESLGGNRLLLGVDRLDYSKGIPDRIKGFERFLESYPEWRGKVTLLQITPKSRTEVREYGEIEAEVTGLIGRVNGRFGDAAWTPIRYVNRSYSRTVLAGMYRAADVAPGDAVARRDGIVAKEYLAAQDPDDPACLFYPSSRARRASSNRRCSSIRTRSTRWRGRSSARSKCRSRSGASGMRRCWRTSRRMTSRNGPRIT